MRICVFHNLKNGGAIHYLHKITEILEKKNTVDTYSFQKNNTKINGNYFYEKINTPKNILHYTYLILITLRLKSKKIAKVINNKKYDLIIVNNDHLIQSPYILRYLSRQNNILFISHEPKREFYEKTTYDHNSIKRSLLRFLRFYIKIIDISNCKKANIIITNSYYSQHTFHKIYNKKSYVIYPGLKKTSIKKQYVINDNKYLSFNDLSRLKGHHLSINLVKKTKKISLLISGRKNNDKNHIYKLANNNSRICINENISNKRKKTLLSMGKIFLCNQIKEPFGISTLEITNNNNYVIGLNSGGNSEIIYHGINGFISPKNKLRKTLEYYNNKKYIQYYKYIKISWLDTTEKILSLYHFLKNEPAY